MKKIVLAALAALLFTFGVGPIAVAGEYPEFMGRDSDGLIPSWYKHFTGKQLDNSTVSGATTLDGVDFGFESKLVELCLKLPTATVYIRFSPTFTTNPTSISALRAPASTSAAFIAGLTTTASVGDTQAYRALPLTGSTSVGGTSPPTTNLFPQCHRFPVRARGVIMHVVSGLATIDVRAFR